MKKISNKSGWVVALGVIFGATLFACEEQTDIFNNEKKAQNDQEIRAYLSQQGISAQRTDEGLFYRVVSPGTSGQKAAVGDQIQVNYTLSRLDGYLVDSNGRSTPKTAVYGASRLNNTIGQSILNDQAMVILFDRLVKEGDSVTLFVPFNLGLGSTGSLQLPAYSPYRLDMKVLAIRTEKEQLDEYAKKYNIQTATPTESGLRFGLVTARPDSALLNESSTYSVKYTGRLTDNTIFDSGTLDATLSSNSLVAGFTEGLKKLRVGEKANFLFPSTLGYGPQGKGTNIPPYAPLHFEVEVLRKK
ncbi:FKBP-type peptidyl-prolyl cis-trans isomerase [Telluribacter sp.]|jgi:FKBP-type peptidyl-prolyl cis-trans isomerase|uniref:FKBP-type peptidyl-prolyl cis-trans isomerase n=1 Tax=Telluribacter sp. TaxID=1978767 RepID=UPI002E12BBDD|nr:FKBP-type peptidyl-prolyl cis-trans isomerase [Telluribacter sp.]